MDGYKHVVDVEYCPPVLSEGPHFPPEAAKAKEAAQNSPSMQNTLEYHEIIEGSPTAAVKRMLIFIIAPYQMTLFISSQRK